MLGGGLSDRMYTTGEVKEKYAREGIWQGAHTAVENIVYTSVSMRIRTTKRTAVIVPYITQGYMGTPNNLA